MNFVIKNLDIIVIATFLFGNLVLGIFSGRGIKSLKEYAIGDRNFSTAALAATIIATWISGDSFAMTITETYQDGIWFLVAGGGDVFALLIIGNILAPRMKEFFGQLSVAEAMGNMFGKHVRTITALASLAQCIGQTALQIKIFSVLFSHFLGVNSVYATVASSSVVVMYSAIGGIKSVTLTDLLQFLTFGVFVPAFALITWYIFGDEEKIVTIFTSHPLFEVSQIMDIHHINFWPYLFLLMYFAIPSLNSTMFHRTLMARDTNQIRTSFTIAGAVAIAIHLLICSVGVVIFADNSTLDANNVAMGIVDSFTFPGSKGLVVIGIAAMIMSTADSWINTGSVIFVHDLCKPLGISEKRDLMLSRICAASIGAAAIVMALEATNLLKLLLLQANFYRPIVTVPLILAIFGFRSSAKSVLIAIGFGIATVIVWRMYIQEITGIDSVMPGMCANLIGLFLAHYLLKQPGGWVGIKDDSELKKIRHIRKEQANYLFKLIQNIPQNIREFNIIKYCLKNVPKDDISYIYFALGTLLSTLIIGVIDHNVLKIHSNPVMALHLISLTTATAFLGYKLWNDKIRKTYIGIIWYFAIFVILAYTSSMFVLFTKFSPISLVVFILDLVMIGILLNWGIALLMAFSGSVLATLSYGALIDYAHVANMPNNYITIGFILTSFACFTVAFIKPTQEALTIANAKSQHLWEKVRDMDRQVAKAEYLKTEFLNNINHEVRTPMTGITSMGQILYEEYDKLSETTRKECIKNIAMSSDRLKSLMTNILDLSSLTSLKLDLNLTKVNLGELTKERVEYCKKMYLDSKKLTFELNIEDDVYTRCDLYHISHTIDNLIINAITYSRPETAIQVSVKNIAGGVEFTIRDEGLGIPPKEVFDIFKPFTVSSNTYTASGGRGVGLSLCYAVLTNHNGRIWAESDGKNWAEFKFKL